MVNMWNGLPILLFLLKMTQKRSIKFVFYILLNCILNVALKYSIKEARPEGSSPYIWDSEYGMPSGHAQISFFIAFYKWNKIRKEVNIMLLSLAILTGIQRIYTKNHTSKQVFVGALVGIILAKLLP